MSTVTTLISRIRRRLEDPTALHWPDTEIIGAVNESKADLFDLVYSRNRDILNTRAVEYNWPSNTMSVDFETLYPSADVGLYDFILISKTPTTDSTSVDNRPVPLRRVNFEELYRHTSSDSLFYDTFQDQDGNASVWAGSGRSVRESTLRWAQQGFKLYIDPIPRIEIKLRLEVLHRFQEFDEAGGHNGSEVFPGEEAGFKRWERIVEYMATAILKGRSDEANDPVLMQLQSKIQLLNDWLDARSQAGTPRVVVDGY